MELTQTIIIHLSKFERHRKKKRVKNQPFHKQDSLAQKLTPSQPPNREREREPQRVSSPSLSLSLPSPPARSLLKRETVALRSQNPFFSLSSQLQLMFFQCLLRVREQTPYATVSTSSTSWWLWAAAAAASVVAAAVAVAVAVADPAACELLLLDGSPTMAAGALLGMGAGVGGAACRSDPLAAVGGGGKTRVGVVIG